MGVNLLYLLLSVFFVVFAGVMSGLTLGLMSQDVMELKVLQMSGDSKQKASANKILPVSQISTLLVQVCVQVVENPHLTLVTLVLCNSIAVEALPIFLDRLVHEVTAIVLSVTVVLVFGEILPQAVCCRYGLIIGAYSASFVRVLTWLTFPIAWPISKILDWAIGADRIAIMKRPELKALVSLHSNIRGLGGGLSEDEVNVILGALDMQNKRVETAMTPLEKVFMLSADDVLDQKTIHNIVRTGHSRIPVYAHNNRKEILGLILVKELVLIDPDDKKRVQDMKVRSVPYLPSNAPMYDVLNLFKVGRSHMAVLTKTEDPSHSQTLQHIDWNTVSDAAGKEPLGIVTIEDLIEELIRGEIVDETDQYIDNLQTARVNATIMMSRLPPHVKKWLAVKPGGLERRSSFVNNSGRHTSASEDTSSHPLIPRPPQP